MADDELDGTAAPKRNRGKFAKGFSGNLRGRPKHSKNIKTYLREQLSKKVMLTENGVSRSVTRAEAIAIQLVALAAKGDPKGLAAVTSLTRETETGADAMPTSLGREEDIGVFKRIVERLRKASPGSDPETPQ